MNYYKASERVKDHRWDFTCTNDGRTWAIGYCAGWPDYTEEEFNRIPDLRERAAALEKFKDKYHLDGHPDSAAAGSCYRQYLLDNRTSYGGKLIGQQRKCAACGAWTDQYAQVDQEHIYLCSEHATRETLERVYPPMTSAQIASSY